MMSRFVGFVLICACLVLLPGPSTRAQLTTISGNLKVTVGSSFEFSFVELHQLPKQETNPWGGATFTTSPFNVDFGTLAPVSDNQGNVLYMEGAYWYSVMLIANTSGQAYHIAYQGAQTTGGLPDSAVLMMPDYSEADILGVAPFTVVQGPMPASAFLGSPTSAFGTGTVYTSEAAGSGRIIRAYFTISGPPAGAQYPFNYSRGYTSAGAGVGVQQLYTAWQPITPNQSPGVYSGTFTFTLTP